MMGGYSISIRKDEEVILRQEATRRGTDIKTLLKEALRHRLEGIRGGVLRRR